MIVRSFKTNKIVIGAKLFPILDSVLPPLKDRSIVVITSKIIAITQGRIIKKNTGANKNKLIQDESQLYMESAANKKWGIVLTIKDNTLIASAGIDESNGNGFYVLWPKDTFKAAREIWMYLKKKYLLQYLGVIISDSHTTPLRWGTTGIGIAWCGFEPLHNYIDTPDIFARPLHVTKASILDGLTAAAVVTMGEGNEQTPIATITDVPFVSFTNVPPTTREIKEFHITLKEDIYAPLIDSHLWKKGGST